MDKWTDKVALVTGASSGIGRAIAEELVNNGMRVIGLARRNEKLKALAEELKNRPGKLTPLQCDLSNQMEVMRSMEWIEKNMGGVNILVNCAAVKINSAFMDGGVDEWSKTMDVNLIGTTLLTKKVLQLMKKKGIDNNGIIITINTTWGLKVPTMMENLRCAPYIASKWALQAMMECLRMELSQLGSNIKIITVNPGLVDTDMSAQDTQGIQLPIQALQPTDVAKTILCCLTCPDNVLMTDCVIAPIRSTW